MTVGIRSQFRSSGIVFLASVAVVVVSVIIVSVFEVSAIAPLPAQAESRDMAARNAPVILFALFIFKNLPVFCFYVVSGV